MNQPLLSYRPANTSSRTCRPRQDVLAQPAHCGRHGRCYIGFVPCLILFVATSAFAQAIPAVGSVSNDILVAGKTADLTLSGEYIFNASKLIVLGEGGVTATIPNPTTQPATQPSDAKKELKIQIAVTPDAARGPRELRVVTPLGISKSITLYVEDYPAIFEKEPNSAASQAQSIDLPAIIVGAINEGTDVDYYRFNARKGQRLIFEVIASRLGSKLDSSLYLYDAYGKEVAHDEDTNGLDSLIDYKVPEDGQYLLRIQDLRYQGGGDFKYRIKAGEIPYVDSIFPLGGQRGQQVSVELIGRNIDQPKLDMMLNASIPMGPMDVSAATPRGFSNPRTFEVSDLPEMMESEPNDAPAAANPATMPVVVNGRIGQANDVDSFKVKAPATQPIVFEVFAQRYGSALDALLTVMDAQGNVLQRNDDAMGADARIQISAEKDKEYIVSVTDLLGRGGSNYPYRLQITAPVQDQPDFEAVFLPEAPRVARGSNTKLWCQIKRKGGFEGDVVIALMDLPEGITCQPLLLRNKEKSSGLMVISSTADAPLGFYPLTLAATATMNGKPVTRTLTPRGINKSAPEIYLTVVDTPPFTVAGFDEMYRSDPATITADIERLEKKLQMQTPELDAALARWVADMASKEQWQPLEDVTLITRYGAKLTLQPDGTILSDGPRPAQEVYNIAATTKLKKLTGFKLEVIADDNKGPGRADDGNFVLSDVEIHASPVAGEGPRLVIELHKPKADFVQQGFSIDATLNTREPTHQSGWAVFPQTTQSHWASWEARNPLMTENGTKLMFTLAHHYNGPNFLIRKFRLMVTDKENPAGGFSLPTNILNIINTCSEKRTDEQKTQLATYYRAIAPELQETREKLVHLKAASSPYPPQIVGNGSTNLLVKVNRNSYEGDINLSIEGYSAGFEPKTTDPANINKNLDITPITLKGKETEGVINIKTGGKTEKATRTIVVKADATIDGQPYVQYSQLLPMTVKPAPPEPKKEEKKKDDSPKP